MSRRSRPLKKKRAFSVLRGGGHIESGGEPALARRLVMALRAGREEQAYAESATHGTHPYPARMHPATARHLLAALEPRAVLDPFCGSGTTLVEGRRACLRTIGVDSNPLAVQIARAKTWTAPRAQRQKLARIGAEIAADALAEARSRRGESAAPQRERRPDEARALAGWFAPHVRRELEHIAARIDEVEAAGKEEIAGVLRIALSAILYKVSRRASETDASRVERKIARGAPSRLFGSRVEGLAAGLEELAAAGRAPRPRVLPGDARRLGELGIGAGACDAILTSPPYAGVYDYAEQQRLRMAFFGLPVRRAARAEIGTRRRLGRRRGDRILRDWRRDLSAALAEVSRALASGGRAAVVMGDSAAAGGVVRAGDELRACAPASLSLEAWAWENRPVRGGAENRAFAGTEKHEHVLVFRAL